jgi:hypothetical protein
MDWIEVIEVRIVGRLLRHEAIKAGTVGRLKD